MRQLEVRVRAYANWVGGWEAAPPKHTTGACVGGAVSTTHAGKRVERGPWVWAGGEEGRRPSLQLTCVRAPEKPPKFFHRNWATRPKNPPGTCTRKHGGGGDRVWALSLYPKAQSPMEAQGGGGGEG